MGTVPRCMCCGCRISAGFWVCAACESQYGLKGPVGTWPAWAQTYRRDIEQQLGSDRRWANRMVQSLDTDDLETVDADRLFG